VKKLDSSLTDERVSLVFDSPAAMDVVSSDGKLLRTVLVFSGELLRSQYESIFQVNNELNSVRYSLPSESPLQIDSSDGSISFTSRDTKYKIRAIEDSDGFRAYNIGGPKSERS